MILEKRHDSANLIGIEFNKIKLKDLIYDKKMSIHAENKKE